MISWSASAIPYCIDSRPNETFFAFANFYAFGALFGALLCRDFSAGDRLCVICVASLLFWALLVPPSLPSPRLRDWCFVTQVCERNVPKLQSMRRHIWGFGSGSVPNLNSSRKNWCGAQDGDARTLQVPQQLSFWQCNDRAVDVLN